MRSNDKAKERGRERDRMRREGREAGRGEGDAAAVMGDNNTNQQS